jgi:hypothetical protein
MEKRQETISSQKIESVENAVSVFFGKLGFKRK